jgi:SNF2 family DNA or RNA helicase
MLWGGESIAMSVKKIYVWQAPQRDIYCSDNENTKQSTEEIYQGVSTLEELQPNAAIRGILLDSLVTVISVQWFGSEVLELTYKTPTGKVAKELLYRHDEPRIDVVEPGRPWSFEVDGALFRLVSEAQRIRLAHLFDPVLAVHTSVVDPQPHQITAVYESMLPRQPLRFLLADDPGADKTIMAGLLIKELIARGDLHRCLIFYPGSLAEQWQDEL